MDQPDDAGAATDAATLNSDAAVVEGGIKRREGDTPTPPPPQEAEVINNDHAAPAVGGSPKAGGNTQARRRDYRKRALSSATNGTLETNGSVNGNATSDNNNGFSSLSFMQNSALGSNIMRSGGDHSIVSFGLNFNFDNTSSPSNSDSGEGGDTKKKKADGNDASDDKKPAAKPSAITAPDNKDASGGNNKDKTSKGSSSNQKHSSKSPKKASPSGTNGEDGSDPNSSDSSLNNDSGGSASGGDSNSGSGSGGDGSGGSGWKSTISSLTTSSNQEWMATNDSAAAAAAAVTAAEVTAVVNKATGAAKMSPEGMETDGRPASNNQDAAVGKKRKADATKGTNGRGEDDDGYKTDEEQWGGRGRNKDGNVIRPNISSHKGALKVSTQKSDGPPVKQARFSLDQHPSAVARTDDSQQPVSSLTGSSGTDSASADAAAVTASATQTAHQSSSATPATSFNPMGAGAQNTGAPNPVTSAGKRGGGVAAAASGNKTSMDKTRREQRNAREKERSCRIAKQIDDLRTLLSRGGVIVAKGTKSSVLAEAANYINILQQQQVQWEIDRQSLMQQMQQVGAAPLHQVLPQGMSVAAAASQSAAQINSISPNDYKFVFNNSSVGMAIASMGGAFVDCNDIFCQLSDYTKAEVCSMTIFNMTARTDLQHAFDLISQMITPPSAEDQQKKSNTIVLRGAMKNRTDLGLSVSLIKGDLGIAKCFCVTLVKILSMETSRPDTVSIEMELPHVETSSKQQSNGFGVFPAYTTG
mmetsp:Transcript_2902/g.4898  ORF Transcript_2902/g.4898 Transcript_2902/m.4898 type:complete len:757 (-) Transcript_2902:212-2482(-)|eukprot:scaffold3927_cov152-Skeletonema_menzelii.AAC.10